MISGIPHEVLGSVKSEFDFKNEYKAILWHLADDTPTIEGGDQSLILDYLNNGGRVLFSGTYARVPKEKDGRDKPRHLVYEGRQPCGRVEATMNAE